MNACNFTHICENLINCAGGNRPHYTPLGNLAGAAKFGRVFQISLGFPRIEMSPTAGVRVQETFLKGSQGNAVFIGRNHFFYVAEI